MRGSTRRAMLTVARFETQALGARSRYSAEKGVARNVSSFVMVAVVGRLDPFNRESRINPFGGIARLDASETSPGTASPSGGAHRVLEVARLASGAKSMQAFLSDVVGGAAERYANQPEIRAILQSIEEYPARRDGKLKRIEGDAKKARTRRS
jgi:hypothetical protein